ncbi:hypothetical protein [Noviherbaspirillum galbum]|uniref:Uncharacterized protein n=1 Tax=Noviherbaspirillum galbum TaxID=2709383 RepID=A0A6B3STV4_9BURK|nr:hypothetical protein [Noviherbaspirillum galbum]NEX64167.1 hypothetical protein [Noviherbaspirillum galbum]
MEMSTQDVLKAFDALGGTVHDIHEIKQEIEQRHAKEGCDPHDITHAIGRAINEGKLAWTPMRALRRLS